MTNFWHVSSGQSSNRRVWSGNNGQADEAGGAAETESDALTNDILDPAVLGDGSGAAGDPNASTDDDSADPALVPIVDFALRKGLAESNITPYKNNDERF